MRNDPMRRCEIVYVSEARGKNPKGWFWRSVDDERQTSKQTFPLFYECVTAARASGYSPDIKCS